MFTRTWEKARAGSPNHVNHDDGEINGKVHRGEIEGYHGIYLWNAWEFCKKKRCRRPCTGRR